MATRIWAGLDVGVETTSLCVINDDGEILQEASCPTDLMSIHREIKWLKRRRFAKVALESATGIALARGLRSLGYSVDLYEVRQLSKFLRVRRNKTDAGDALGIAEAGRLGQTVIAKVYLKSLECQSLQSRLAIRRRLIRQRVAAANLLCRQIEAYGGRISCCKRSMQLRGQIEAELRTLFGRTANPVSSALLHLLDHCEKLIAYQHAVDRELNRLALENECCRRFMEIPGVGPLCALTFYATVGDPHRFSSSADVGPYFGLTPKLHQSGLTTRLGRISRMGNRATRALLVRAGVGFVKWSEGDSALRAWALQIEQRRGRGQSRVALARKLAVTMLAMWKSGEPYKPALMVPSG